MDQIDYLGLKNIAIFVIVPALGPLCEALTERGIKFAVVTNPWWTKRLFADTQTERASTLASARTMANLFRQWNINIVYTHTIVAPAGALAAMMAGIPHVWHIHEFSHNPECIEMTMPRPALAQFLTLSSNLIVFNSSAVALEWEELLPPTKTKIVRNWVQVNPASETVAADSAFKLKDDCFNLAVVGSVLPWKRQMDAVQATANLISENLNVSLSIVGPTPNFEYRDVILGFIEEHKLQARIRLFGYLENPECVVKQSKATLGCSHLEPFGRVTIESMMHGVPVVATNSGGTPEIIEDEISGLLYPVGDVPALTSQLRRLINDEELRRKLSQNAIQRVAQFSSREKEMDPLIDRLFSICDEHNPSWPVGEIMATQSCLNNSRLGNKIWPQLRAGARYAKGIASKLIKRKSRA